jgi:cellulose synthase/poly-beta-1,6-N-acetylglucosamine synthase-like glycosyltransferase
MITILVALHLAGVFGLAVYGLLGFVTLGLFLRHRHETKARPAVAANQWPIVTVQLPLYNEREVVVRLLEAAAALDYPRDRLQIQVLDDSTDETTTLAATWVRERQSEGLDLTLIHRNERHGFKAGALAAGTAGARGEFIALFDADFVPRPDFLRKTVPYLLADPHLGAVQARWGHLNDGDSSLTGAQAIALDKHFAVEQLVRFRADCFPKFNGSAGVWRRACIDDVGGWQGDTLCEDLCLSTRAVLGGWRFHFADDVVAPAELPATILAYKNQQARWAMGATQCLTKYAAPIWRAPEHSLLARLYALLSMSAYATHLLLLILLLVQFPLILSGYRLPSWLVVFSLFGLGQPILFVLAQQALYRDWRRRARHLPALLLLAIGTAPSNGWAVLWGLFGRGFIFVRTPKGSRRSYRLSAGRMVWVEVALGLYAAAVLLLALLTGNAGSIFLPLACLLGFGYVVGRAWRESRPAAEA